MEDSIARMRQMTVLSNVLLEPEGVAQKRMPIGSRPNYNIDFEAERTF